MSHRTKLNTHATHTAHTGLLAGQRILLVDDSEEDRMLLSGFLLRHGRDCMSHGTGRTATTRRRLCGPI
ncbi:PleD family two-component response regulator [Herbaspirillum frisingense]|uniref:PleD family two-component response regulator n=1 Tax=Herbaspirillum frisingense TaxID=92645 RepID=A0ABU1PIY4_9BURK|nr:PleD family two-component response regulator [Herbaspirillum frisingense]